MFQQDSLNSDLSPHPQSQEILVEPFPEAKLGKVSQASNTAIELKVTSPIPSPSEIVEKMLSQMSDFPEDEEKDKPTPDKPVKGSRFLSFFSS